MKARLFLVMLLFLTVSLFAQAQDVELYRFSNMGYHTLGYAGMTTYSTDSNYSFYYDLASPLVLDSMYVESTTIENPYDQPFHHDYNCVGDYSLVELPGCYTLATAYGEGVPFKRIIVKSTEGRFLSDTFYKIDSGNFYSRRSYEYDENGRIATIYYHFVPTSAVSDSYYKIQRMYDDLGRKTTEIRYTSTDSITWTPKWKYAYAYDPWGGTISSNYKINDYAPYISFDTFGSPEVVSGYKLWQIYRSSWFGDHWEYISDIIHNFEYTIFDDSSLRVKCNGRFEEDFDYELTFNAIGQLINKKIIKPDGKNTVYSFSWQEVPLPVSTSDPTATKPTVVINAYPNPFSQAIQIALPSRGNACTALSIYNVRGQKVKDIPVVKNNNLYWDGTDSYGKATANGVYFVRAAVDNQTITKKIMLIR